MISCKAPSRAAYGWQRDGGHADFMLAEERTLVPLPDELTYLDGAAVACGLGTAYAACLRAGVSGRHRVLITGLGPVGLGMVQLYVALGARVIGIDAIEERRTLARRLGAQAVIEPGPSALQGVLEASDGLGVEVAIDCSGNAEARRLCLEAARDWGRAVYVGEGGSVTFEPSPLLLHKQLTLFGPWVCSIGQNGRAGRKLVRWRLHPEAIVRIGSRWRRPRSHIKRSTAATPARWPSCGRKHERIA